MTPVPTRFLADALDLSPRVKRSATVTGSPAAAAETIVATSPATGELQFGLGVLVIAYAAVTVGTNGTALTWRIRQTDLSGTVIKSSGAKTVTAANLVDELICGVDTAPAVAGQVYVLTLTVTAGSAASTVSAVEIVTVAV